MKLLVIYARPDTEGYGPRILKKVVSTLKEKKAKFEVVDLYKINYDPVLREKEHYTTQGNREISAENKLFQKKIKENDLLVFIYPVWWGSMPAILKGWIDRVFTAKFAFEYRNGFPVGLLKGKKAIVFMTLGGPLFFYRAIFNPPKMTIAFNILRFCGIKSKVYQFGNCNKFNENKMNKIERKIEKVFSKYGK